MFPFNENIIPSVDVSISKDKPINFEDAENFEVPKLHEVGKILKVAKSDGNVEDPEVGEIFESGGHQEEDANASYCDIEYSLNNDKIPPSK